MFYFLTKLCINITNTGDNAERITPINKKEADGIIKGLRLYCREYKSITDNLKLYYGVYSDDDEVFGRLHPSFKTIQEIYSLKGEPEKAKVLEELSRRIH